MSNTSKLGFKNVKEKLKLILKDPVFWVMAIYNLSPIDIIPDAFPLIGSADDLIAMIIAMLRQMGYGNSGFSMQGGRVDLKGTLTNVARESFTQSQYQQPYAQPAEYITPSGNEYQQQLIQQMNNSSQAFNQQPFMQQQPQPTQQYVGDYRVPQTTMNQTSNVSLKNAALNVASKAVTKIKNAGPTLEEYQKSVQQSEQENMSDATVSYGNVSIDMNDMLQ